MRFLNTRLSFKKDQILYIFSALTDNKNTACLQTWRQFLYFF